MDPEQVMDDVLAGRMGVDQLLVFTRKAEQAYRRPKLTVDTIDEYSDWEIRVQELTRGLSKFTKMAHDLADRNISRALIIAEVVHAISLLLPESNAPAHGNFLLGYLRWKAHKYFDAVAPLNEAANAYGRLGDSIMEVSALSYLSDTLRQSKQLEEALDAASHLLQRASECKLNGHMASALRDIGQNLNDLGRKDEAVDKARRAVEVRRTLSQEEERQQFVPPLPAFLDALGTVARSSGLYEEAVTAFQEVAELEKARGDSHHHAVAISEIGYTYIQAGEKDRGLGYLEEAAEIAASSGSAGQAERWQRQVETWRAKKTDVAHQAETISPTVASTAEEAYQLSTMAAQLATLGLHKEALVAARAALHWAQMAKDFHLEISVRSVIAKVHSDQNDLEEAVAEARRAIVVADRVQDQSSMLLLRASLANGLLRQQKHQAAEAVLMDGIARSQMLLYKTEGSEFRQSILAGSLHLYEQYAFLLSHFRSHDQLLWITELARARNLYGWLQAETSLQDLSKGQSPNAHAAVAMRELRTLEVEVEVRHLMRRLDSQLSSSLNGRRESARNRIDEWRRQSGLPEVAWQTMEHDRSAMETMLEDVVQPGTGLLCMFAVSEGVCPVFVWRKENQIEKSGDFVPWERDKRLAALAEWTGDSDFARGRGRVVRFERDASRRGQTVTSRFDRFIAEIRRNLIDKLVPLISAADITKLAVIPHRELFLFPYWGLLDTCSCIESFVIAPSVGVLRLCQKRRRSARGETILLEDPTGSLTNVPGEIAIVARARKENRISRPKALREIYESSGHCTLFHAATHGLFIPERPYHSGLVASTEQDLGGLFAQFVDKNLEPVDKPAREGARLLTVAEVMTNLALDHARLVVLSACESGIPRQHGGGEMTGLTAAFLLSGAQSVLASLWPAHDAGTALLMDAFYRLWEGGTGDYASPAQALAEARRTLRRLTRSDAKEALARLCPRENVPPGTHPFSHPVYADAFECFGVW